MGAIPAVAQGDRPDNDQPGQDRDEQVSWSVILKILQSPANMGWVNMGEGDDPTYWNYWKRECYVYQSDLLDSLPVGMAAPRCFGIVELPGNIAWLWLEDITDSFGGAWSLERYALAAYHLGLLNGTYSCSRPLPTLPWLATNLAQQWVAQFQTKWQSLPWDHPRVMARYPKENSFRRMLLENERFLTMLNFLPRTVCHGDTYPTNFMSRHLADGQEQTVALDWAMVNVGPLGDDLGQLAFGAHTNLREAKRADITETLFGSYTAGLRESGCQFDSQWVRFGFTASAALRVGLFQIFLLSEELNQSKINSEEVGEHSAVTDCFEVAMANEAYELIESTSMR